MPLDQALQELSRRAGLPIWLDPRGLAEAGVKSDSPVTFAASGMTFSGVLDRMLRVELGYFFQCGELVVTSAERAEQRMYPRLYAVADLGAAAALDALEAGPLANYTSDTGGPGQLSVLGQDWLVATADVVRHGQIEDWLAERRTGKAPPRAAERRALEIERESSTA